MSNKTAVVILNWNGVNHLRTYLPSVIQYSDSASIYVADNASTDDSIKVLKDEFPKVKLIINKENGGFAKGYNDALKNLEEEYFILLNSDVEVINNWIQPIIDYFEENESCAIAQPKIKAYLQKDEFEYAGAAGGFIDYLGYPFCQGRLFQSMEKDLGQYETRKEVFWASGACMFIRSSVFKKLGGFDINYFAHMEEIDLCWRAKNRGYQVYYIPDSTVFHLGGGSLQSSNPRKTFLNFRNSLTTLYKNDQSNYTILKIIWRMKLDALAFMKFLLSNGADHAWAIVRAHFSFYAMPKKRTKAIDVNKTGIYNGSIVWEYFFRSRKKFTQLKKAFS